MPLLIKAVIYHSRVLCLFLWSFPPLHARMPVSDFAWGVIKQNTLAREANPQLFFPNLTQIWPLFKSRTGAGAWRKTRKPTLEHELRGRVIFPFYLAKQKFQEMENNPNRKCIQTVWDGMNGWRFTTVVHSAFIRLFVLSNRTTLWSSIHVAPHQPHNSGTAEPV